jgi:predicted HTH transcriptional regulator
MGIFVSSVQKELAAERRAMKDFIEGDPLLRQYFDVFLFEDLPAGNQTPNQLYIGQVDKSSVYLGIFGDQYGWEDTESISPTEREFDRATLKKKPRLVFVKGTNDAQRHPKMLALIKKAERQLTRRRFGDVSDLTGKVYASLIQHLEQRGVLPHRPFDAAACPRATLKDIDADKIAWFIERARQERNFALKTDTPPDQTLIQLNLLDDKNLTHAAVLLFGRNPQKFLPSAEIKCMHFHGTEVVKPILDYKVFKGTVFDQADQATDFVFTKLARSVGTRDSGVAAPVAYEMPKRVVAEAVVNALVHRDYASRAAVQVYVFADRVEVWNPGELPPSLTPERLRQQHPSLPGNPLVAESMFLAHYIEKAGTGTLDVIEGCRESHLPEPEFQQDGDHFIIRLWRDRFTVELLDSLVLTERQKQGVAQVKQNGRITNAEYQRLTGLTRKTSARDLDALVDKGVFRRIGEKRGTYYVLAGGK